MNRSGATLRPAAFLDRDGVINVDHGYVYRREDFAFVPGVLEGARRLHDLGYALVVATNQSGIGRGLYTEQDFMALTKWMKESFSAAEAPIAGVYFCPHHPSAALADYRTNCQCRKPGPGMLLKAAEELGLDLATSAMFGDRVSDLEAARAAGVPTRVLLATDGVGDPAQAPAGLATHRYARLDDALADSELVGRFRAPAGAG
jgi:D-glycero-D-manno-heptose 1,7-bisphosphate phosphatase